MRNIRILAGLCAFFVLALAAPGARAADTVVRGKDATVYKKKTTIDFSDVSIDGELTKPEGQYGYSRGKTRFNSLVKLRKHFNPELQRSADQL